MHIKTFSDMSNLATFNSMLREEKTQMMVRTALHEDANEYFRNIAPLVANDPNLQRCDPVTIICGGLQASSLKLPLNKSLQFAYLIPFNNHGKAEAQFQIGAKGLLQLAMRSGQFNCINVDSVYEGELSKMDKRSGIIELDGEKKSDKVVGYFAYFKLLNGFEKMVYMSKEDVVKHGKRYSKSFNNGPWQTDFDAMAKKTVLKQLLTRYAPMSVDMTSAIKADQAVIREDNVMDYVDNPANVDEQAQPISDEQSEQIMNKVAENRQRVAASMAQDAPAPTIEDMPENGEFEEA